MPKENNFLPSARETLQIYAPFIAELRRDFPLGHGDAAVEKARNEPRLFFIRNKLALVASLHVGKARQFLGEMYYAARHGKSTSAHYNPERIERMIKVRKYGALEMARLACSACPIAADCGLGHEGLIERLQDPYDRRTFRRRLRNPKNNHYCETNLTHEPLKGNVA